MSDTTKATGKKGNPGASWILTADDILAGVSTLRPEQLLRPDAAGALLQVTLDTLQTMREKGTGPIFAKIGGSIVYEVQDVRDWIKSKKQINTSGAMVCKFSSFGDFLSNGAANDYYIFAEKDGQIFDFWYSLQAEITDFSVVWLSLSEYIARLKHQSDKRFSENEQRELQEITSEFQARKDEKTKF